MKSFSENLVAVMSGVGIRRRWKSEVSPWYNFFDEIELTPFSREEAEALVREPVAGVFRWQPQAVERVLELSQLKPYLVQKLCVHAVNHMLEAGRSTIRREDVEVARAAVTSEDVDGEPAIPEPAGSVAD
jgi:histone H3/H4